MRKSAPNLSPGSSYKKKRSKNTVPVTYNGVVTYKRVPVEPMRSRKQMSPVALRRQNYSHASLSPRQSPRSQVLSDYEVEEEDMYNDSDMVNCVLQYFFEAFKQLIFIIYNDHFHYRVVRVISVPN